MNEIVQFNGIDLTSMYISVLVRNISARHFVVLDLFQGRLVVECANAAELGAR